MPEKFSVRALPQFAIFQNWVKRAFFSDFADTPTPFSIATPPLPHYEGVLLSRVSVLNGTRPEPFLH